MQIIYSISIRFLFVGIWLAQFFNPKAKKWILGRKNWLQNLPQIDRNREVIWFHCASLGEFDQGLPLMNRLKKENPEIYLLVTFFSPSGFENYQKRQHKVDFACYLPLDTKKNAQLILNHFQVKSLFIVKYEFWCNLIFEAKRQNIKIYSICAIFRPNHRFFKTYGSLFRKALMCFDRIFVQNQESVDLLKSISYENVSLVGDMRFDRVLENKSQVQKDEILEHFLYGEKSFILGSSWSIDENFLKTEIKKFDGKVIIAPHEIGEKHISEIEGLFQNQTTRYTNFDKTNSSKKILIVDCIGKLSNAYSYGDFAYVGGGFTGSLHNILEPAVFGLPVIFGPKHSRFPEAQLFIDEGIGFSVSSQEELKKTISKIQVEKSTLSQKTADFIEKNKGVVDSILREL
ncbi:MAG: glycosyltransferase N-terminal domain-containing protein [Bacteroidota bacterium]